MSGVGQYLERLYALAESLNRRNIVELVGQHPLGTLCDLGCDDGRWTAELAIACGGPKAYGVEIVAGRADEARRRGITVAVGDLDHRFPFEDDQMDVVHANQVIEHVGDVDHFMAEIHRILRPGGTIVVSTENGSSWHNVAAAAMGWQIFSATNVSKLAEGLGNPLAMHRGRIPMASWTHKTIFNFRGLRELVEAHGFRVVRMMGAGYYPFPASVGRLDPRHAHFISIKGVKVRR